MVNVGIDLHKTQFTTCERVNRRESSDRYTTDAEGYGRFLAKVKRRQAAGHEVQVGVESTGNTRYFKEKMEAAGVKVVVINTLKFKVVNESVKKTDKHDAATIAEFLEKDMLPESHLCSRESEQMRRLLKARATPVRAEVVMKNQIHAFLTAEGMEDENAGLQSKKGRQRVLDALKQRKYGLVAEATALPTLFDTIDRLEENIKGIETELRNLAKGDHVVELLQTIPGCGEIGAWTIRAYTDDIKRFGSAKKYTAYAGLVPWVQNSNETIHHGKITKRGPEELRTALVQVVMGMRRLKTTTYSWRMMARYEAMKKAKCSGKSIIATARKVATSIRHMLTEDVEFDISLMVDKKLERKAKEMKAKSANGNDAEIEDASSLKKVSKREHKSSATAQKTKTVVGKTGVAGKNRKVG